MKKLILFGSGLISILFATTINVPSDYTTIQAGINASVDGDTVLVAPGEIYYENLKITRSITLASHAIFDDLTDWNFFNEIFWQWEVTNNNINIVLVYLT